MGSVNLKTGEFADNPAVDPAGDALDPASLTSSAAASRSVLREDRRTTELHMKALHYI